MSGKMLSSKALAYRSLIWLVVGMLLVGITGCGGDAPTPTPVSQILPTGPADTPTPAPTSTPVPSATPTEIPIVLPTATPPRPNLPATAPFYQEQFTPAPTSSPVPTSLPAPSVTPYVPARVVPLSIYQVPLFNYDQLDRVVPPAFTTQCIAQQHFLPPTPTPIPTPTPVPPGVVVVLPPNTPTPVPTTQAVPVLPAGLRPAAANAWVTSFNTRYFLDARRNSIRIAAPTFTPIPTNTPVPTRTPLPFPTQDVFSGTTPRPLNTPTVTPAPTRVPPVPTSTPSLSQRFSPQGTLTGNFIQSVFISDVTALLVGSTTQPTNFAVMWHVMNDLVLALVNVDTPLEVSLRAYERYLDQAISTILSRDLRDPRLAPTGEERYANRKVIVGNVPDLRAFRYLKPCFSDERIIQAQNEYNALINRVVAKYPGRAYVADLSRLNWLGNPLWVTPQNGYEVTESGADAIADAFGAVFDRILPTL